MERRNLKLNLWLKQRPRLMLCCSKADRGILIGRLLQVNRYLHIGPPISTAPRVASSFAGRGAASAASMKDYNLFHLMKRGAGGLGGSEALSRSSRESAWGRRALYGSLVYGWCLPSPGPRES